MSEKKSIKSIAIVHDVLLEYGGAEKMLDGLLEALPEAEVYTSVRETNVVKKLSNLGGRKIHVSWMQHFWKPFLPRRIIQLFSFLVWAFFDLKKFDIIIFQTGFYMSKLAVLSSHKSEARLVYYFITPPKNIYMKESCQLIDHILFYTYYPILRMIDKKFTLSSASYFSMSKAVQSRIKKIYNYSSMILYPPVIEAKKVVNKFKKSKNVFGYAGRLSSEKNLELLVRTFSKLPNVNLEIIGEGPSLESLKKIAGKNVSFLGFFEKNHLYKKISTWNAFIHPSFDDDFTIGAVEAINLGVPVIAHKSGGITDYLIDGINGTYFDQLTEESLKNAINKHLLSQFNSFDLKVSVKGFSHANFLSQVRNMVYG